MEYFVKNNKIWNILQLLLTGLLLNSFVVRAQITEVYLGDCPEGQNGSQTVEDSQNRCFIITPETSTRDSATSKCRLLGLELNGKAGSLANIDTKQAQDAVSKFTETDELKFTRNFWIGGTYRERDEWRWENDNTKVPESDRSGIFSNGRTRKRRDASESNERGACYDATSLPDSNHVQVLNLASGDHPDEDPRGTCADFCDSNRYEMMVLKFYERHTAVDCQCYNDRDLQTSRFDQRSISECNFDCAVPSRNECEERINVISVEDYLSAIGNEPPADDRMAVCYMVGDTSFESSGRFDLITRDDQDRGRDVDPQRDCVMECDRRGRSYASVMFSAAAYVACSCGSRRNGFSTEIGGCDYNCVANGDRCMMSYQLIDVAEYIRSNSQEAPQSGCFEEGGGYFDNRGSVTLSTIQDQVDAKAECATICRDNRSPYGAVLFIRGSVEADCLCGDDTSDFRRSSDECQYDCAFYHNHNRNNCEDVLNLFEIEELPQDSPPIRTDRCYSIGRGNFEHQGDFTLSNGDNARELCEDSCRAERFLYAAIRFRRDQDYITCYCGNELEGFSAEDPNGCQYDCYDNNNCDSAYHLIDVPEDSQPPSNRMAVCYMNGDENFETVGDFDLISRDDLDNRRNVDPQRDCVEECDSRRQSYASVRFTPRNSITCSCGASDRDFTTEISGCDYECALDGGRCMLSYHLIDVANYLNDNPISSPQSGCFTSGTGSFSMVGTLALSKFTSSQNPKEECMNLCRNDGSSYGAIRFYEGADDVDCYCGDDTSDFRGDVDQCKYDCALYHDRGINRCTDGYDLFEVEGTPPVRTNTCYRRGRGSFDQQANVYYSDGALRETCEDSCGRLGFPYAAIRFRSGADYVTCYCGDELAGFTEEDSSRCRYDCYDDNNCEDAYHLVDVSETPPDPAVRTDRCYLEGRGGTFRSMSDFNINGGDVRQLCEDTCRDDNSPYAAIRFRENEAIVTCYCGSELEGFRNEDSNACRYDCYDNGDCVNAYYLIDVPEPPPDPTVRTDRCYLEGRGGTFRRMSDINYNEGDVRQLCEDICRDDNSPYAAIRFRENEAYVTCYCGSELEGFRNEEPNACYYDCYDNGNCVNAYYLTDVPEPPPDPTVRTDRCYLEGRGETFRSRSNFNYNEGDVRQLCEDSCRDNNSPYAAIRFRENEAYVSCYCGSELEGFRNEDSSACDYDCYDNRNCVSAYYLIDVPEPPPDPTVRTDRCYLDGRGETFRSMSDFNINGGDVRQLCEDICRDDNSPYAAIRFRENEVYVSCYCGSELEGFRNEDPNACDYNCYDNGNCVNAYYVIDVPEPSTDPITTERCYINGRGETFQQRSALNYRDGNLRQMCENDCASERAPYAAIRFRPGADYVTCYCGTQLEGFSDEDPSACRYDCYDDNSCVSAYHLIDVPDEQEPVEVNRCYGRKPDDALRLDRYYFEDADVRLSCENSCRDEGYKYTTVRFYEGREYIRCYCVEELQGFSAREEDSACDYDCASDLNDNLCEDAYHLIAVPDSPPPVYPDTCYLYGIDPTYVEAGRFYFSDGNVKEACQDLCRDRDELYAAIQFREGRDSIVCHCGSVLSGFSRSNANACDYNCASDSRSVSCQNAYDLVTVPEPPPILPDRCYSADSRGADFERRETFELENSRENLPDRRQACIDKCGEFGTLYAAIQFRENYDSIDCYCGNDLTGFKKEMTENGACDYGCARYHDAGNNFCVDSYDLRRVIGNPATGGCFKHGGDGFQYVNREYSLSEESNSIRRNCSLYCRDYTDHEYSMLQFQQGNANVVCRCGNDLSDFSNSSNACNYDCSSPGTPPCESVRDLIRIVDLVGPRPNPVNGGCFVRQDSSFQYQSIYALPTRIELEKGEGDHPEEQCVNICNGKQLYASVKFMADSQMVECHCGNEIADFHIPSESCDYACAKDHNVGTNECDNGHHLININNYITMRKEKRIWDDDEPSSDLDKNCVVIRSDTNMKMKSKECSRKCGSICQYNMNEDVCRDKGKLYIKDLSVCFGINNDEVGMFSAKTMCHNDGGYLMKWSPGIRQAIYGLIQDEDYWIGATRASVVTDDGREFKYTNFMSSEPDGNNEECLQMSTRSATRFQWDVAACDQINFFICEVENNVPRTTPEPTTTPTSKKPDQTTAVVTTIANNDTTTTPVTEKQKPSTKDPNSIGQFSAKETDTFTTGVIAAVVVCAVAILIALIKVMVSCCKKRQADDALLADGRSIESGAAGSRIKEGKKTSNENVEDKNKWPSRWLRTLRE